MISRVERLKTELSEGRLLARQLPLAPDKEPIWAMTDTGERVHMRAISKAFDEDLIKPVTFDIAGEPYEWGISDGKEAS